MVFCPPTRQLRRCFEWLLSAALGTSRSFVEALKKAGGLDVLAALGSVSLELVPVEGVEGFIQNG